MNCSLDIYAHTDKTSQIYKHYPKLFDSYFGCLKSNTIEDLSKAGYCYYHVVLGLDSIIDDNQTDKISSTINLQELAIRILASVFGENTSFWDLWNKRKMEYFEAIKIERNLAENEEIDFRIYEDLADKKSAFGKVAIDSLYILDENPNKEIYDALLLSHKYFSVGFQLYDDVKDFKEDFEKGQFNIAIYKLKKKIDIDLYKNEVTILNKLLYIRGIGQEILQESVEQFEKALSILSELGIKSKWLETVVDMRNTIEGYLDITNGYMETINARLDLKKEKINPYTFIDYGKINDSSIKRGLDFIRADFYQNYADLKHIMYLGKLEGFENNSQIHVSDTFQRALINDCFITVANTNKLDISAFLESECHYLIDHRNKDEIGGWSYFQTVHEIAADIDDLGQIIQLFVLSGNQQLVNEYCKKAINIAVNERRLNDGSIETWIIPKDCQNTLQKRQEYFNETKWGKGPDVEVVANFVYALHIFDKTRYKGIIEKSLQYIISQQNNEGFWESRWYYGNYYGTYVCLRLLKEFDENYLTEIQKGIDYLYENQNNDGGFSIKANGVSDALSTALAMLSLKFFFQEKNGCIRRATKYLDKKQNIDGSWSAVDFIKPKIHEPCKNKTLTSAYVLKALCL